MKTLRTHWQTFSTKLENETKLNDILIKAAV